MRISNSIPVLVLIFLVLSNIHLIGQSANQVNPDWETGSIENQIDYLIRSSNNYQDYKVIKKASIFQLKTNILDSLNAINQSMASSQNRVREQESTINSLNDRLKNLQADLDKTNKEKGSISFMGIQMNKGAYQAMMWAIILGLLGLLGFFVLRFRQSHSITMQARNDLEETRKEFDDHRKRSLEREQKAMRKLQDVLNKGGV